MMSAGDALPTARRVASRIGIGSRAVQPRALEKETSPGSAAGRHGRWNDRRGVNDAPALKQAEVGIAVANATDVAKAAPSLALTNPGLTAILAAVKTSRRIYSQAHLHV